MTMDDVAARLRISRRKLQDILRDHPYYLQVGRSKRFAEEDFQRLIAALRHPVHPSAERRFQGDLNPPLSEAEIRRRLLKHQAARKPKRAKRGRP